MKLWLDDVRDPVRYGKLGWVWARTAKEAIALLITGKVEQASLDHDLGMPSCKTCRDACLSVEEFERVMELGCPHGEETGYHVVCWLEEHPQFLPAKGTEVHSANPAGAERMRKVLERLYTGVNPKTGPSKPQGGQR